MTHRTWNYWIASAFILGGMAVVLFNYLVDPYEVFGHHYLRSGYAINERFRKVEHILRDDVRHDAYILGSSVMGVYDPAVASRLSGHSYYNLSFLAGTPQEAFDALRVLKQHNKPIKEVLIGIDFFSFYERPKTTPSVRPHPAVSGEAWPSFYLSYLFAPGIWQGLMRITHHLAAQPSIEFDMDGSGMYHLFEYDRAMIADPTQYRQAHFPANSWKGEQIRWVDERFVEFAALCKWIDDNRIKARFFIHPFYRDTLMSLSDESYLEFKTRMLEIRPDIVDFSVSQEIIQDKQWFYDKRHYRGVVADLVMANML